MANIDRADWHYGGDYPAGLPQENGGTHIGMFLAWVIFAGLGSKRLKEYGGEAYRKVLERRATGRDLLFSELDEKFFTDLLTKEGQQFVKSYYETNGYISDYDVVLGGDLESLYHVADSWENYDKIAFVLDQRLQEWRARNRS